MATETVIVVPSEPVLEPVIDGQIADAAERVVEAASAAVAMAEVEAARTIADNEEDMAWLRMTVKSQAEQIEALSSTCQSMQEQLSLIPQALAVTAEASEEAATIAIAAAEVALAAEAGAIQTLEPVTTDTHATDPASASSTEMEASEKSAAEKAADRRPARGLLRRRK